MFYTNIYRQSNNILERYIDDDGQDKIRKILYQPYCFIHTKNDQIYKDIYGKNVTVREFNNIYECQNFRKEMKEMNIEVCGMDNYALLYIQSIYSGPISFDITKLRIANIDIETNAKFGFPDQYKADRAIELITHYDSIQDKYFTFSLFDWEISKSELDKDILDKVVFKKFNSENEMLLEYLLFWEEFTPHIISGWNINGYDLPFIINRYNRLFGETLTKRFSPFGIINKYGLDDKPSYEIIGVANLDYMELYKKFRFEPRPSYKLDTITEIELGQNKIHYEGPIWRFAEENPQRYVDYNIIDVHLINGLDKKLNYIMLACVLAYYSHINLVDVLSPVKTWDSIIFNSLADKNIVIPENRRHHAEDFDGAYVKEPILGQLYRWIVSTDLTSLYPSIMRQGNISPETIVGSFDPEPIINYINKTAQRPSNIYSATPNGMLYRKDVEGVIPAEVAKVFFQRKQAKTNEFLCDKVSTEAELLLDKRPIDIQAMLENPNIDTLLEHAKNKDPKHLSQYLNRYSNDQLKSIISLADANEIIFNVMNMALKVTINSAYGALGNAYFRYYDLRNAEAITSFGMLANRWIMRKINEYFNNLYKTNNKDYVIYGDTDSNYLNCEPLVKLILEIAGKTEEEFGIPKIIDFLDKYFKQKIEPYLEESYQELYEYMNNVEQLMHMDREVIASTGFWTAKKKYALDVWDSEGKRNYDEDGNLKPKLKIMGLETRKSSTPPYVSKCLENSIKLILRKDEKSLQDYYKDIYVDYKKQPIDDIVPVQSVNNFNNYMDDRFNILKGANIGIKSVSAYNILRRDKYPDLPPIFDGDKIKVLRLKLPNSLMSPVLGYPSGEKCPTNLDIDFDNIIDHKLMFEKTVERPLELICKAINWEYEKKARLTDIFGDF